MKIERTVPKNTFMNLPEAKRLRIVAAMTREFAQNGYRKASLNSIVKQSGISKGSLYQYFSSKEEIFLFVFEQFTRLVKSSLGTKEVRGAVTKIPFWHAVRHVLKAGLSFVDNHPEYFRLYLRVLFEHDLPQREELIAKVRLFSKEYFSPLVQEGRRTKILRTDISEEMTVFCIDALLDRFLQGYARPYLDGGLNLAKKGSIELEAAIDEIMMLLRDGLGATVKN